MRLLLASILVLAVSVAFAGIASAAPNNNPNTETIPLDCGELGSFNVVTMENSASAFGPDGVLVAKRFSGEATFTATTHDGEEFGPFEDSFDEGGRVKGYQGRLTACTFTEEFTDEFVLDAETAEFFELPEEYIGTEITFEGTFEGTAWVIVPGQH